jgi:hypothetical protein
MATTQPSRVSSPVRRSLPVRLLDKYFYLFMSLLVAAIVIYGFSHTVNGNLFHPTVPRPTLLYFHAACFSGWVAFFLFQSALVRTNNVRIHRLTGWFGAALGTAMVVLGYCTAILMTRFDLHTLHQADVAPFLIVPLSDMTTFAPLLALAIYWRKKRELHRRLILIATCVLTSAAFGRFPMNFPPPAQFYFGVDALILLGVVRDLIVNRRVHKVYLYALPILFACECTTVYLFTHAPAFWVRISRAIIG